MTANATYPPAGPCLPYVFLYKPSHGYTTMTAWESREGCSEHLQLYSTLPGSISCDHTQSTYLSRKLLKKTQH
ncbi:hypothetical protein GJAV_G00170360 [Gymnothorax javanicus]|nr:hypothetical protein GJAV_G00170360 [Gymnothorax javanicus]